MIKRLIRLAYPYGKMRTVLRGPVLSFETAPALTTLLRSNVERNNLGNVAIMETIVRRT